MKQIICIYSEGLESKLAVVEKKGDKIVVKQFFTVDSDMATSKEDSFDDLTGDSILSDDNISFESLDFPDKNQGATEVSEIAAKLSNYDLSKVEFIPVITEPHVTFHIYEGLLEKDRRKTIEIIIKEIETSKGFLIKKDQVDFISLDEKTHLCVFTDQDVAVANTVNAIAAYNGKKRYYKIHSIKNAEIALASFVSRTTKFFPEDYSLIIYIGKEFSKLIFLEGQNLKHIGATLDIGVKNLHTYDVYFSKILLEMENGGVPRLDNVVICGDDRSENLVLSFYGTFPEANISELEFDMFDIVAIPEEERQEISSYSIPIAAAYEYYAEEDKELKGINILPKYIAENQKKIQLGWHSFVLLPLLFIVAGCFSYNIRSGSQEITLLDNKINYLKQLAIQNQGVLDQISAKSARIAGFDEAQAILDSALSGTEVWGATLEKVSNFVERRRNFWISHLETSNGDDISLKGFSLSRSVLTEFSEYSNSSILRNVTCEQLREKDAFAYTMNFKIENNKE